MKEATGELSGTVITVVAIAAVAAIFTIIVLPLIREQIRQRTYCSSATCTGCSATDETCDHCTYYDTNGTQQTISCPNPEYNP